MRKFLASASAVALLALAATGANAQVRINELLINAPGTDNGQEFLELLSDTPNFSLNNIFFLSIDGDGGASGTIDQVVSLTAFSTGANNHFLLRDSNTVLNPAPLPDTNVAVQDFDPDLENGSNTFALVLGFTGSVGDDLDTNGDGSLDSTPWTSVIDVVAWTDGGATDFVYNLGFAGANIFGGSGFTPDAYVVVDGDGYYMDVLGTTPGPYTFAGTENTFPAGATLTTDTLTPGGLNPRFITSAAAPEPGTFALLGMGALAFGVVARRRK
ncbi:MAG: hypothetical protein OHK0029_15890 [Armatimonadaceae bacterium]